MEDATELEYLIWFKREADFGPADSEVHNWMNQKFEQETGKRVPQGWRREE